LISGVMVHADTPGEPYGQWLAVGAGVAFLYGMMRR
jgi:hypothetical protein